MKKKILYLVILVLLILTIIITGLVTKSFISNKSIYIILLSSLIIAPLVVLIVILIWELVSKKNSPYTSYDLTFLSVSLILGYVVYEIFKSTKDNEYSELINIVYYLSIPVVYFISYLLSRALIKAKLKKKQGRS